MHPDTLAAINLVDIAFIDAREVREAYRSFSSAATAEPFSSVSLVERFHGLIISVVREMGLSSEITPADIQRGYYPTILGRLDEAAIADAEEKIARKSAG